MLRKSSAVLLASIIVLSCSYDIASLSPEPKSSLQLTRIVLQENSVPTIELDDDGTVLNLLTTRLEPVIQHRCGPQVLQAKFLKSNGQPDPFVTRESYRLEMNTDILAIARFERWDEFAGNLQGRGLGRTRLHVSLVHVPDSVTVFGPFLITVDVLEIDKDPC